MTQRTKVKPAPALLCGISAALLLLFLIFPDKTAAAASQGIEISVGRLLPSLFPTLFLTDLLMKSLTRSIRKSKAVYALSFVLAQLGGFVCGAKLLADLADCGAIDDESASWALCGMTNAGPAFTVATVGAGLLNNATVGLLIYISLSVASAVCAGIFSDRIRIPDKIVPAAKTGSMFDSLNYAVRASVSICSVCIIAGCILAFIKLVVPDDGYALFAVSAIFEVTSGCLIGSSLRFAPYLCLASSSILSLSIIGQLRALTSGRNISLRPLLISRLIHLPLSLATFRLLLPLCELVAPAAIYRETPLPAFFCATPAFSAAFFLFACSVLVREKR